MESHKIMLNNKASWKGGWEDKSNILTLHILLGMNYLTD